MLTREEFANTFNHMQAGLGDSSSPLWVPEQMPGSIESKWFICVKPFMRTSKKQFWNWCATNLHGQLRCYSSDNENKQEWWGFTDKRDIVLFMLKWG